MRQWCCFLALEVFCGEEVSNRREPRYQKITGKKKIYLITVHIAKAILWIDLLLVKSQIEAVRWVSSEGGCELPESFSMPFRKVGPPWNRRKATGRGRRKFIFWNWKALLEVSKRINPMKDWLRKFKWNRNDTISEHLQNKHHMSHMDSPGCKHKLGPYGSHSPRRSRLSLSPFRSACGDAKEQS